MSSPQERLDKIQSNPLECMNIAADVMELLQTEMHDAPSLKAKVEQFLKKIIDSQVSPPATLSPTLMMCTVYLPRAPHTLHLRILCSLLRDKLMKVFVRSQQGA